MDLVVLNSVDDDSHHPDVIAQKHLKKIVGRDVHPSDIEIIGLYAPIPIDDDIFGYGGKLVFRFEGVTYKIKPPRKLTGNDVREYLSKQRKKAINKVKRVTKRVHGTLMKFRTSKK